MLIISGGMPRSASTWCYRLTNGLIRAAGHPDSRETRDRFLLKSIAIGPNCFIRRMSLISAFRLMLPHLVGCVYAAKTHTIPQDFQKFMRSPRSTALTYIYRDPRDVAVSAYEFGARLRAMNPKDHTARAQAFIPLASIEDAIRKTSDWLRMWQGWMNEEAAYRFRYEDMFSDPLPMIRGLADHLQLDLLEGTIVDVMDEYLGKRINFHRGVSGRYKSVMTTDQIDHCNELWEGYLEEMGYPLEPTAE